MREGEGSDGAGAGDKPGIKAGKDRRSNEVRKSSEKRRLPRDFSGETQGETSSLNNVNVIKQIKEKHSKTDAMELGIYRSLPDGRYISVNQTFARIFGCSSSEEFLAAFVDVGSSYASQGRFEELRNLVLDEGACSIEVQVCTKDGGTKWLSNEVRAVRDEGGAVIYFEGFVQDITPRKRAMEKFHRTFHISPTMMSINSFEDARFIHVNKSFAAGTGYGNEELMGHTISELSILSKDEIELFSNRLKEHGRLHNVEGHFRKKAGEIRDALFSAEIVNIEGETCLLVSAQDITDQKKAEADLRRQSELLSGINDILRKTFTSEKGVEIAEKCLAVARALTRSPLAFLCELSDDMLLEIMASSGYGETDSDAGEAQMMCNLNSDILRRGLKSDGEPLVFNSAAFCAARFLVPQGYSPITCFVGVPVAIDDQVIGLICLANKESGYTGEDVADVKALSVSLVEGLRRIRVEECLRRSEIKYRTLLQSIQDGVVIVDKDGRFVYVNEIIVENSGFTGEQFVGRYMFDIFKPEHRGFLKERFAAMLRGEPPAPFEAVYLNSQGKEEWVEVCYSPIYDGERVSGAIATSRNISWRKAAEEELRIHRDHLEKLVEERTRALEESETRYRHLVDNAVAGVYQSTLGGERLYVNENFLRMIGYESQDEVKSIPPPSQYRNPEERETLVKLLLQAGQVDNYEVELVTKQGGAVNLLLSATLADDIISGFAFDITERKRAEHAIRESEEKYRRLFDLESDAIFLIDTETGLIIDANTAALSLFGYTREELLGKTNVDLSAEPEKTREAILLKLPSIPLRYFRRKDGSTFPAEVVATYLTVAGRPSYFISARDITERRKTEEALLESEKKYRDLVENALAGVYITTVAGKFLYANEPVLRIFGFYSLEELGRENSRLRYKKPEDREKLIHLLLRDGRVNGHEVEMLTKTGETVAVLLSVTRKGDLLSGMMIDITSRKRADDALKASEQNLRIILDSAHDAIFIHDASGKILDVNAKMLEMYGVTRSDALRFSIADDYSSPENDIAGLARDWQAVLEGRTRLFQWKARKPHYGAVFDAEVFLTRIRIDGSDHILAMVRDITERKIAERLVLESEKKYRDLVENALVAVFQAGWDESGHGDITYVNSTFLRLLGYESLDEVRAAGTERIFKDPSVHKALAQALIRDGTVTDQEVELVTKSGETVYWAAAVTHSGKIMSGMARDVTARKKAEALIRQQLIFIEQLLDCVPVPVFYKGTNGIYLGCNKAYTEFLGLPKQRIEGFAAKELFTPDVVDMHFRTDQELIKTGGVRSYETRIPHADGTIRDVIYTKATYDDAEGKVGGIVGVIQDITERKQSENLLRTSETKYRTLFDHSNDAVFLLKDSIIVDCNEKTLATFRGLKKDIVGRPPHALSPPMQPDGRDSEEAAIAAIEAALAGVPQFFEWRHQRLNGEHFDSEVILNHVDLGELSVVQAQVRDVSVRKEAELKIRESEEKYRKLVENSLVAMLQTNMEGRVLYVNDAFLRMFDHDSPRDIMKINVQKLIARRQDWRVIQKKCINEGHVNNIELEAHTGTGNLLTAVGAVTCDGSTMTWMLVDITERRRMEQELKAKSEDLYESNTALKVLLNQRNKDKREIEEKVLSNVKDLVFPYIENLTGTALSPRQETLVSAIRANLDEIISPFLKNMRYQYSHFTPMEVKVAGFIRDGKTVKEIANILGVSESAVNLHRQHIRNKLGLTNEKINLRTHLQSFVD